MQTNNKAYLGSRDDLIALINGRFERVLDVGCAQGALGALLKAERPECKVVGVELDGQMAQRAAACLDEVLVGDALIQLQILLDRGARFDLVMLGDVLEHLEDPWTALRLVRGLCPNGEVIVSIPNVGHYSTLLSLILKQHWPYRERGIHDRTHLRFFGRANLAPLFADAGFAIDKLQVRYRLIERPSIVNGKITTAISKLPLLRRFLAYKFLCRLR